MGVGISPGTWPDAHADKKLRVDADVRCGHDQL